MGDREKGERGMWNGGWRPETGDRKKGYLINFTERAVVLIELL
jgi:hypothetical protein